jgi:hypothetical protein
MTDRADDAASVSEFRSGQFPSSNYHQANRRTRRWRRRSSRKRRYSGRTVNEIGSHYSFCAVPPLKTWWIFMTRKPYVFEHFLIVSRRGAPPNPWCWEIRRKSRPTDGGISNDGFRSAKAAEEAGKIALAAVREVARKEQALEQLAKRLKHLEKVARRAEVTAEKAARNTPERRSENARKAGKARARALSAEVRAEISRRGGLASKGKPKTKRV